ncbi:MAG TPA: IS30 family transposase, partial [Acidimicrobiia bacterium]|nr:IS30 family transposase [Acidimicrobiia bacterium]
SETSGRYPKLSPEERKRIVGLMADGMRTVDIARTVARSASTVRLVAQQAGRVARRLEWNPSPARLSAGEREEIRSGLDAGQSLRAIASRLGRAPSTVSREVNSNGGRGNYRGWRAHRRASDRARRPRVAKLASCARLRAQVETWLAEELWSPTQISAQLRIEFPDDPMMRVSPETIYQSLYVQGRGALRKELSACLRSGRATRRTRSRSERPRGIPDRVMICDRPAEVEDRAVPGHWEGDLIIGKDNKSAVGTLVERSTRYVLLLHLPADHGAEAVRTAMAAKIKRLPEHLVRSITWDQGTEMAHHVAFTVDTGVAVYFCDPHSPWQRGTNENTNGLLRQWMPKGTDLSLFTELDLDTIAYKLNNRPRQTLGWVKPSQALAGLVAATG